MGNDIVSNTEVKVAEVTDIKLHNSLEKSLRPLHLVLSDPLPFLVTPIGYDLESRTITLQRV